MMKAVILLFPKCFGILCLTKENHSDPGILFDAGLLTNILPKHKLFGMLCGLEETEISRPLQRLSLLSVRKDDIWKLIQTINENTGDRALNNVLLEDIFNTFWTIFENKTEAMTNFGENPAVKTQFDIPVMKYESVMLEMLATVRALEKRLQVPGLERVRAEEPAGNEEKPFQDSIAGLIRKMSATSYSEEEIISFLKKIGIPDSYTRYTVHKTLGNGVHLELHKK